MGKVSMTTDVLTIRVPRELGKKLTREARRRRRTRSQLARELLENGLSGTSGDAYKAEARRQSLLVRDRDSEREVLDWIMHAADLRGWE